jgi:hypothetical protein
MRQGVGDAKRVATCLEFGPRFLRSTGQAYKGGPNTGVFLQITCSVRSRRAKPEVIFRCWWNATAALYAFISVLTLPPA